MNTSWVCTTSHFKTKSLTEEIKALKLNENIGSHVNFKKLLHCCSCQSDFLSFPVNQRQKIDMLISVINCWKGQSSTMQIKFEFKYYMKQCISNFLFIFFSGGRGTGDDGTGHSMARWWEIAAPPTESSLTDSFSGLITLWSIFNG